MAFGESVMVHIFLLLFDLEYLAHQEFIFAIFPFMFDEDIISLHIQWFMGFPHIKQQLRDKNEMK